MLDGLKKTCKKYKVVSTRRGRELRCADFRKGRGHPPCDRRLVAGGRSPGLLRGRRCHRRVRRG